MIWRPDHDVYITSIYICRLEKEDSPAASEGSKASLPPTELVYQPIHLPAVLANYYDPSLVQHISSWPAEQLETRVGSLTNMYTYLPFFCSTRANQFKGLTHP